MAWNATRFLEELNRTVDAFDRPGGAKLSDELVARLNDGEALEPGVGRKVLGTLRRKCYFDLMEQVAEALRSAGVDDDQIRRQYAQALIDQGKTSAAAYVLELLDRTTRDPEEKAEAQGLLGRIGKQLYVNAVNADPSAATKPAQRRNLERALAAYEPVYRSNPSRYSWHGINTVALLARAKRDGVTLASTADAAAIASDILAIVEAMPVSEHSPPYWDLATAAEASLALGKVEQALTWIAKYVSRPEADAFELSSTERQLREVWGLTLDDPAGALLLPLLQASILQRQGGNVRLQPSEVGTALARTKEASGSRQLEQILGKDGVVSLKWYQQGLERARSVAQIRTSTGEGYGTGFLVRGGDIVAELGDELLLLTNAHVVSDDPDVQKAERSLPSKDAVVVFEALETAAGKEYGVAKLMWSSPPRELDATLLRLEPPVAGVPTVPMAAQLPARDGKQKVYVIGHPGGRGLSFSLQDNLLLDYDERLIHYRAPTEGGSSGSPVFNQQWKLIGLHHAGGFGLQKLNGQPGTYDANEGIVMARILEAYRATHR